MAKDITGTCRSIKYGKKHYDKHLEDRLEEHAVRVVFVGSLDGVPEPEAGIQSPQLTGDDAEDDDDGWGVGNTFRDGHVHVKRNQCPTCIYRPVNKGRIHGITDERRNQMQADADMDGSTITCHTTLGTDQNAACKGYHDNGNSFALRMAHAMKVIVWVG